jgi:ABC-type transporter Mla MlaB component
MKKFIPYRGYALALRKRATRRCRSKSRRQHKQLKNFGAKYRDRAISKQSGWTMMELPADIRLDEAASRKTLINFFENFRFRLVQEKKNIRLDLRRVKRVSLSGLVYFLAEVDRTIRLRNDRQSVSAIPPSSDILKQLFHQTGFFKMFESKFKFESTDDSVKYWRLISDTTTNIKCAADWLDVIKERVDEGLRPGIVEAMANVAEHSFEEIRGDGLPDPEDRRWWMLAEVNEMDNFVAVAVCDLGIGIPRSLQRELHPLAKFINGMIGKGLITNLDSSIIRLSLRAGESNLKLPHRGNGLPEIKRVVEKIGSGYIEILSNRGTYRYDALKKEETVRDYKLSLRGTLVLWALPILASKTESDVTI